MKISWILPNLLTLKKIIKNEQEIKSFSRFFLFNFRWTRDSRLFQPYGSILDRFPMVLPKPLRCSISWKILDRCRLWQRISRRLLSWQQNHHRCLGQWRRWNRQIIIQVKKFGFSVKSQFLFWFHQHTIRKVKFFSKNSILTKPQHFHEFFTQIFFFCYFFCESKVVNS